MKEGQSPAQSALRSELLAAAEEWRPELHRYCARLMGSVIEGEDVVQDALTSALIAIDEKQQDVRTLRAWLFRVAHNRALDLLRSRALRATEPIDAADEVADDTIEDPVERLMLQQAIGSAVSRFTELPVAQRSVIILKDVLDEPLADIAALLDLTIDSVKAHLSRGRARLREINASAAPNEPVDAKPVSEALARYVSLFNGRDWDGLRALLADDVKLHQSSYPVRVGSADVGRFFSIYATIEGLWLVPAWLGGREVVAVFSTRTSVAPDYFMWLEWLDGRISFIRDYRHVSYVIDDAELILAPPTRRQDAERPSD